MMIRPACGPVGKAVLRPQLIVDKPDLGRGFERPDKPIL